MDLTGIALIAAISAWLLLLGEGLVLLAVLRQVGILHSRIAPKSAYDRAEGGPQVGVALPRAEVLTLTGSTVELGIPSVRPRAVLFITTSCALCRDVMSSFRAFHSAVRDRVDTVILVDGDPPDAARTRDKYGVPEEAQVAAAHGVFEQYRVESTPWLMLLASDGGVLSRGIVNDLEQMELTVDSIFEDTRARPTRQGVTA